MLNSFPVRQGGRIPAERGVKITTPSDDCHRLHKPGVAGSSPAAASFSLRLDEPIADYHSDREWWSNSQIRSLRTNGPQWFQAAHLHGHVEPYASSDALARGTEVHRWAEVGWDQWYQSVAVYPEEALGASGRRTKATDEWESAQKPGTTFLKQSELQSLEAQFRAIEANPLFQELKDQTIQQEMSIRWKDRIGLKLKCRPDAVTDRGAWDLKTTREINPSKTWFDSVVKYGYGHQQVHYLAGLETAGYAAKDFIFFVTSTVYPYATEVVRLPHEYVDQCRSEWRETLIELSSRLDMDHWTPEGYGEIRELWMPSYLIKKRKRNGKVSRNER